MNSVLMLAIAGLGVYFLMHQASTAQQSGTPSGGTIPGGNTAAGGTTQTPQQATQSIAQGGTFTSPAVTGANTAPVQNAATLPSSIAISPTLTQFKNLPYDAAGIYQRLVSAAGAYGTVGMTPYQWSLLLAQVSPVMNPPDPALVFEHYQLSGMMTPGEYWQSMAPYLARLGLSGIGGWAS